MPHPSFQPARLALCLSAALILGGCAAALPHRIEPQRGAAPPPPAAPPRQAAPAAPEAPPAPPTPELSADMPLPRLPAYARPDDGPLASEAAGDELRRARERTGLSDAQLARLQAAQQQLAAGDSASALTALQSLNAELAAERRSYTVQEGESLWHIAAHPEVYRNPYLWPLLWSANQERVRKPYQVYKGMRLQVPLHPTVQEVSAALAYGQSHASEGKAAAGAEPPAKTPSP
jgi:hypothetical protein